MNGGTGTGAAPIQDYSRERITYASNDGKGVMATIGEPETHYTPILGEPSPILFERRGYRVRGVDKRGIVDTVDYIGAGRKTAIEFAKEDGLANIKIKPIFLRRRR